MDMHLIIKKKAGGGVGWFGSLQDVLVHCSPEASVGFSHSDICLDFRGLSPPQYSVLLAIFFSSIFSKSTAIFLQLTD